MFEILALLTVLGVLRLLFEIFSFRSCPTDHDLRAFFQGTLKGSEYDRIIGHIGSCSKCQNKANDFNEGKTNPDDYLID